MNLKIQDVVVITAFLWGLIWQVYKTSRFYFQYPTNVYISLEQTEEDLVPGLTVCAALDIRNATALSSIYPNENYTEDVGLRKIERAFLSAPIDKLHKYTDFAGDLNLSCIIKCVNDERFTSHGSFCSDVSCERYAESIQTLAYRRKDILKCITYFHNTNRSKPYMERNNFEKNFINIEIYSSESVDLLIDMHSQYAIPYINHRGYTLLDTDRMKVASIDYQLIKVNLLPSPYVTDCDNYETYTSGRLGCFEECQKTIYLSNVSVWPQVVPAKSEVTYSFEEKERTHYWTYRQRLMRLNKICNQNCPLPQCHTYTFDHRIRFIDGSHDIPHNISRKIKIQRPTRFDMVYSHRPAIQFIEFFSFIGSALGMWFNISCITLYKFFKKWSIKLDTIFCEDPDISKNVAPEPIIPKYLKPRYRSEFINKLNLKKTKNGPKRNYLSMFSYY